MLLTDLQKQVSLGEDSRRQLKADVRNTKRPTTQFSQRTSRTLRLTNPYRGLGSGTKRALSEWDKIDFQNDESGNLFTATVKRKRSGKAKSTVKTPRRIGQLLNNNSLAADLGVDIKTVQSWLNILEASYIIFRLAPHHQNFRKRIVKQHKLYFTDTGIAASLLDIETPDQLETHFLRGGLFENYVILEFLKQRYNQGRPSNLYFWRDHVGNEVDLLLDQAGTLTPIEIKSGATLSGGLYDSLKRFATITQSGARQGQLIYGGDRSVTRQVPRRLATTAERTTGPAHSWRRFKQPNWANHLQA